MRSFFKKLHHHHDDDGNQQQDQSYVPPPRYSTFEESNSDKKASSSSAYNQHNEASSSSSTPYAPPPGPPPNWTAPAASSSASASAAEPPPYHDWTIIPDNALLPPPPPLAYDVSPTANASAADGKAAYQWCLQHPLASPLQLTRAQLAALGAGHVAFAAPPSCFAGELHAAVGAGSANKPGRYAGRSHSAARDVCLLTALPLYSARAHNPLLNPNHNPNRNSKSTTKTIYFELGIRGVGGIASSSSLAEADAGLAIGYVAPPYPAWRLPGWQRGSLGVHGDDGRRYVNDTFGGADFTTAWRAGERVGLGLVFRAPDAPPPAYAGHGSGGIPRVAVDVFFTRNGERAGGWDMAGELDERALGGKEGLEGECDLYGAVGLFGGVDFEVFFNREDWLFKPDE